MARKATTLLTGTALLTMAAVLPFSGAAQASPTYSLPHLASPVAGTTWTATVSEDKGAPQDLATLLKVDHLTPETSTAAATTEAFTKLVGTRAVGADCDASPVQVTFTAALGGDASKQETLPLCLTTAGWQVNAKAAASVAERLSFAEASSTLTATPAVAASATAAPTAAVRAMAVKAAVAADDPTDTATTTPGGTDGDDPTDTSTATDPGDTDTTTPAPNPTSTTTPAPNPTDTTTPAPNPTSTTEAPNPTHTAPNPTTTQAPPPADASSFNVTGRFYKDLDKSGNFTAGDAPLAGKALSLYNAATNSIVAQLKTDANGYYKFSELPKGSYELRWTADGAVGTLQQGPTTVGGSNAAVITSYPFDLIDGDITGVDFGMIYSKGGAATTPSTPGKSNSGTYVFPGKTTAPAPKKSTTAPAPTTVTPTTTDVTPSDTSTPSTTTSDTEEPVKGKVNSGELSSRKNGGLLAWSAGLLGLGGVTLGSGLKPARKRSKK